MFHQCLLERLACSHCASPVAVLALPSGSEVLTQHGLQILLDSRRKVTQPEGAVQAHAQPPALLCFAFSWSQHAVRHPLLCSLITGKPKAESRA